MKEVPLKPGGVGSELDDDCDLYVAISDALSERDKIKFTVCTKTTLPLFQKPEVSVVRQHEEFLWLHGSLEDCSDYVAFLIPPAPPRPDFSASREKLQRLGESEGSMTKEEFNKTKQELEQEYLATFKKTVAMHETFLTRLATHPVFKNDHNFRVFLEYEQDLSVRGKNRKERLQGMVRSISKTTDELLLQATQRDIDEFFEAEKCYVLVYHEHIKEATLRSDRMTRGIKNLADCYIRISSELLQLATQESTCQQQQQQHLHRQLLQISEIYDHVRKCDNRVASDYDLKLSDTLRYYQRDSTAVKSLLYRRLRFLADYEQANKQLDRARSRNREIHLAETQQQEACEKFESISVKSKEELVSFKKRRVVAFKKHLTALCELQLQHARAQHDYLKKSIEALQAM